MRRRYVLVSGFTFGAVATLHALRLIYDLPVTIGDWALPGWPSGVAALVAAVLCIWGLSLSGKRKR
ncbi:MAG: hypothetical protein IH851_07490 [Armatimonadetes bacterium]|nr:hypothetical protein [Armatimonadota bacterium]